MGLSKKILLGVCLIIFLFILGMMVRRFYDNYFLNKPLMSSSATADAGKLHLVVEPAKTVPPEFKKAVQDRVDSAQSSGLRPPEKKDN